MDARMGTRVYCGCLHPAHFLLYGSICCMCNSPPSSSYSTTKTSQTSGYDGSMMNGLNILPSYTDYFTLNAATLGLNTASIFIGGFWGPIFSGIMSDRLGRRPTLFWGSVITLIGVLLQTAAQNIAMFVVARIVLGFGGAVSGIAGAVYLSETFSSRWRAWGVGLLNDFY
jgi:MFS family permease